MTEKKNEIFVRKYEERYLLTFKAYFNNKKIKTYSQCGDFYESINNILNWPYNFYKNGIAEIKFEENPIIAIPEIEKQTIEKLVKRLEKDARENKNLKYSLKMICELSKDEKSFSQYKIIKQE